MRGSRVGLFAISERSAIPVKGLTVAARDAMTRVRHLSCAQDDARPVRNALEREREREREREQGMSKKTEADTPPPLKAATRLVVGGRDASANHGFVNPPVYHASTVLYPSAEDFLARRSRYLYGRR